MRVPPNAVMALDDEDTSPRPCEQRRSRQPTDSRADNDGVVAVFAGFSVESHFITEWCLGFISICASINLHLGRIVSRQPVFYHEFHQPDAVAIGRIFTREDPWHVLAKVKIQQLPGQGPAYVLANPE